MRKLGAASWDRLIVWAWLLSLAAVRAGSPDERDPCWEARAGLENLAGTPLARPDTWSWAPTGGLFYPNSPAWNAALGLGWAAGRYWGLFAVTFGAIGCYLAIAYALARRLGAPRLAALAGIMGCSLLAFPMLSGRATMVVQAMLLLALAAPGAWRPRAGAAPPVLGALVAGVAGFVLSGIGNWVHLSWLVLAPVVAVAWLAYGLLAPLDPPPSGRHPARLADPRRWAPVVGGIAGLAGGVLVSPYGLATGLERSLATQRACVGLILEWSSIVTPRVHPQWAVFGVLTLTLSALTVAWPLRDWRRVLRDERLATVTLLGLVALPVAVAGLAMIRFLGISMLTAAPVAGCLIAGATRRAARWAHGRPQAGVAGFVGRWATSHPWRVVTSIVSVLLLPGAVWLGPVRHATPPETAALATLPAGCRLLATGGASGVALLTRPDVTVWVDGRADYYGRARMVEADTFYSGQGETTAPSGATCIVLAAPGEREAVPLLTARIEADPLWHHQGRVEGYDVWVVAG